jgi:hypothetical protein
MTQPKRPWKEEEDVRRVEELVQTPFYLLTQADRAFISRNFLIYCYADPEEREYWKGKQKGGKK